MCLLTKKTSQWKKKLCFAISKFPKLSDKAEMYFICWYYEQNILYQEHWYQV